jgi:hypothetical protein
MITLLVHELLSYLLESLGRAILDSLNSNGKTIFRLGHMSAPKKNHSFEIAIALYSTIYFATETVTNE